MTQDIKIIDKANPAYPTLLREINDPPTKLYLRGDLPTSNLPIAIVGTRKASRAGLEIAESFAEELGKRGAVIISGLAIGIDSAAHRGALKARAKTMAVLGCGIDEVYPAQNQNLANEILNSDGVIISEYGPGIPSYKNNFLERNRIISGLSIATIIIEAPIRSGSIRTAHLAAEEGRNVFVIPGPISHPNFAGSHKLIREGATLVSSIEDILEELNMAVSASLNELAAPRLNPDESLIYEFIKEAGEPINIDKIIEATKLQPKTVNRSIAAMVISGFIKENADQYTI